MVVGEPQFPSASWRGYVLLVVISAAIGPLIHRLVSTISTSNVALRRSEAEFRATFENAPIPMAVVGLHGDTTNRWIRVNRALCELFGRSAAELTSVKIVELTHPEDRELTEARFDQALEPDAPHRIEKRYLHKSGRHDLGVGVLLGDPRRGRRAVLPGHPDRGPRACAGSPTRRLLDAIETDRQATERLKQIDRIRSEMASTVSHELRTPLTSAAGYVELLAEGDAGPLTDEQRDMLDTVARSLTRLDGIVDDVLGMASPGQHGPVDPGIGRPRRRCCRRPSTRWRCRRPRAGRT